MHSRNAMNIADQRRANVSIFVQQIMILIKGVQGERSEKSGRRSGQDNQAGFKQPSYLNIPGMCHRT
jgi:hypothetical protein